MPVTEDQLKALDKLNEYATKRLAQLPDDFHNPERRDMANVSRHVEHIKDSHENKYAWSAVEGSLATLREIVRRYKIDLSK